MPGRNDPCPCDSGKKWKQCHGRIENAAPEYRYGIAQQVYADSWAASSASHEKAGLYDWMAEQLISYIPKRILDIGCGTGEGVAALFRRFAPLRVIAIDENRECLGKAGRNLSTRGVDTEVVLRFQTLDTPQGYQHDKEPILAETNHACTLIEADVSDDEMLWEYLRNSEPFDVITVWLTGVHSMRQQHAKVRNRGIDSDAAHRLMVQNDAYDLAGEILRPGGVLHVVDRVFNPSKEVQDEILQSHTEQAFGTGLQVQGLQLRSYIEPDGRRMPVRMNSKVAGTQIHKGNTALSSVVSVKRAKN